MTLIVVLLKIVNDAASGNSVDELSKNWNDGNISHIITGKLTVTVR
jgi:hypothetical protein